MPARREWPATRSLAWLYSPAAQRPLLAALYAIEQEIGASVRPGLDHQVAHARLAWWREECVRCVAGQPVHPLTCEVAAAIAPRARTALAGLAGLVDTAVWDLAAATFETRRELDAYCERWSAAMIEPVGSLALPAGTSAALRALGRSLRELELLLALAPDARAGRLRLPLDELAHAGAGPGELARPPWSADLAALVRARHRALRAALAVSVATLGRAPQAALRGVVVWAAITVRASARAEARLPDADPTGEPRVWSDGWRAWRAARRAATGRGLGPVD
jgi:15-cis-phytoene synthase